ncbi:hypothetical protein [Cupriavidus sp.]|uniref:hypothetical protein n=1 Tax=Cupriavidus sp. TaxID=1873897 RepID=UPI0025C59B90|nr:hypothetical protein [Cupriavidus sp.]MCA3184245.1 hypothetical protein [Cupriavidus sp.]MCA3189977.1 hypothetical protein [Cupriavidus sp.]MCA3196876.1 hypothetical protein [Cupriavidus sp.]MCA3204375.1 hypothetical protein [Cupriavidus sp.]MCA3207942.1 hypothetical protein [Cupriavidus sp.]
MKIQDLALAALLCLILVPFAVFPEWLAAYKAFNGQHGMVMAFIKFGVLATLGEVIGLRIRTGHYLRKGFGVLPKMVVWGMLGLFISMAFKVFAVGSPYFAEYLGIEGVVAAMAGGFTMLKLAGALMISILMNLVFSPVMMTAHKITDMHIARHHGSLLALCRPIAVAEHLQAIDWQTQWGFVFKKTIPFFWIPAHGLTFLLPPDSQILFAAVLGVALGIVLAIAGPKPAQPVPA